MKRTLSIAMAARPKTIVAAVAVAVCSAGAYAGDYDHSGATAPVIIAGDAGQDNTLTVNGGTIGSIGTPSVGAGGFPSLISVGGENGVTPFNYGNITINANDLSLYGRNTSATGLEGIYAKTGTANSTIKVDLSDSTINVGSLGNYTGAILAEHKEVSGLVDITITNSNLTNAYTGAALPQSSKAVYASSLGSAVILIDGSSTVTSSGLNASAVSTWTSTGLSKITSSATINTTGTNAYGIAAASTSGSIVVDAQGGTINTNGSAAHGINAITTSSGAIDITNKANVTAAGDNSSAIKVVGNGSGNVEVKHEVGATVRATGTVVTGGDGSAISVQKTTSGTGDITVTVNGNVYTESQFRGIGVLAENYGQGNATIIATGNVTAAATKVSSAGNSTSFGLYAGVGNPTLAPNAQGDATIKYSQGTITTAGDSAYAMYGLQAGKSGNVEVRNDGGTLITSGAGSYGIWGRNLATDPASATSGNVTVFNSGSITTGGLGAHGVFAFTNRGSIDVTNKKNVTATGDNASAINVAAGGAGDIVVNHQAGAIARTTGTTTADNGTVQVTAIHINKTAGSTGDVSVIADGDIYTESNNRGIGVFVENYGQGNATIVATGNVTAAATNASLTGANRYSHGLAAAVGNPGLPPTAQGDAIVRYSTGTVSTAGNDAYALYAYTIAKSGNTEIRNNGGTLLTTGSNSHGIYAYNTTTDPVSATSGNATAYNSGAITTSGASAYAITARSTTGNVTVDNNGTLTTNGSGSNGIHVGNGVNVGANNATITNTGNITVNGTGAIGYGIYARVNGDITTNSSGNLTIADGQGISVDTVGTGASSTVNASGNITTARVVAGAANGIESSSRTGTSTVNFDNGTIKTVGNSVGIASYDRSSNSVDNKSIINVGSNATVDSSQGRDALQIRTNGYGEINIAAGATIHGGSRTAIQSGATGTAATNHVINNGGVIDATSDVILLADTTTAPGSTLKFSNSGMMTGAVTVSTMETSLTNSGTWNLRNLTDTDSDGVRDTLSVAVSDFGSSGNNTITNSGVIALLGDNGQASTLNSNGAYSTGYVANTMALGGAVQGQILNVKTFTNSGVIDMGPANAAVGDVLVISGGSTPGTSGGGTYIANGGRVILDTVLNEGGSNSQSDMLIVDGTQLGSSADKVKVINVGGTGAVTVGNGIELVRVLDKDRSAGGVYQLDGRLVSGLYEYDLHQGGVGADSSDGNWYLRSVGKGDTPRAESGVYLRNMSSASTMFMHTLHDRLGEPQFTDSSKDETNGKTTSLWVRVSGNHAEGSAAESRIDLDTDTTLVHLGGDLARWSNNGQDRWQVGLMGAYGQSDTDASLVDEKVANNGMRRTANGKVEGYSVGAYGTWYGNKDKPTGPYVDTWAQYGWYNNKVQGNGLAEEKYDSTGWTVSVEGGYAFIANDGEKRQWMIEPQAQLAYNSYSADDHYERTTNTWVRDGNSDGVIGRLGARMYSRSKLGDNGLQPFVEANWWYNSGKYDLSFNGAKVNDDTPDSTFELKAGLQGQIAKGWQLWGHVGGRWGENSYSSYEGMVGVKHQF